MARGFGSSFGLLSYPTFQTGQAPDPQQMAGFGFNMPRKPRPFGLLNPPVQTAEAEAPEQAAQPTQLVSNKPQQPVGQPMDIKPPGLLAPEQTQGEGILGGFDKAIDKLGNIYGNGGSGDALINLGLAIASPGNMAENIQRAMAASASQKMAQGQMDLQKMRAANEAAKMAGSAALAKRTNPNLTDAEALVAGSNPNVVQDAVRGPDQFSTSTDAQGNMIQKNNRTGEIKILQEGGKEWQPLVDPAERAKQGIPQDDKSVYRISTTGKVERVGQPTTAVTVNNAVNPILKGMGEQFVSGAEVARAQAGAIKSVHAAREQLDSAGGIISGAGADAKLALQKIGSALGVTNPDAIANTETFRAAIKPIVLDTIKGLGAGSGISNADRDFALQAVGGTIALDEKSIRRILDVTERAAREKIATHNKLADEMVKQQPDLGAVGPMLRIQEPGPYQPPQARQPQPMQQPAQQQMQPMMRRAVGGKTYEKRADGWYEVQ